MSKGHYTIVFRYDVDGEGCDPPAHIIERLVHAVQHLHERGFGLDITYGKTDSKDYQKFIEGFKQ